MKYLARLLALTLPLATTAVAAPLEKAMVAADAKWLLHLDLDKCRSAKVGDYFVREVLEKNLTQPKASLKREFNFDLDLSKIRSITAYGTDFHSKPDANGVLLIQTELDLQKALDAMIEKMSNDSGGSQVTLKKAHQGKVISYSLNDDAFVSIHPGNLVLLGKSHESVQKAAEVLSGKSANLTSSKAFSGFPDLQKSFFFLGVAEGFSPDALTTSDGGGSPQAKMLKMADGGRVALGENADQLFLNLALKAKSSEVVMQMQQIIQGLIALASLSQPDNKDLMQLAQSAKVSADDNIVSLNLEYPVEKAIQKLRDNSIPFLQKKNNQGKEADRESDTPPKEKQE